MPERGTEQNEVETEVRGEMRDSFSKLLVRLALGPAALHSTRTIEPGRSRDGHAISSAMLA
ncbi:hypothetical protein J6590_026804 [Homalodisca vitripennis]|nr:hypothetical protein J6590_026804 [Homalodisca vitripennis]